MSCPGFRVALVIEKVFPIPLINLAQEGQKVQEGNTQISGDPSEPLLGIVIKKIRLHLVVDREGHDEQLEAVLHGKLLQG